MSSHVKRMAASATLLALAGTAIVAGATSASADSFKDVNNLSDQARCIDQSVAWGGDAALCLYYHGDGSGAMWASSNSVDDLTNSHFFSGTGSGAGDEVRNAAAAMENEIDQDATSFVYVDYVGNGDYTTPGQAGELFYTWNNEASVGFFLG